MTDISSNPPNYELAVNNRQVPAGLKRLIQSVEYESVDGVADQLRMTVVDHFDDEGRLIVRDSKIFQTGNLISVFMGYGPNLTHIGGVVIRKLRMSYPQTGNPTITVIGYTRDTEMADHAPEAPEEQRENATTGATTRPRRKSGEVQGRRFKEAKYSDAVRQRAGGYNMVRDVDETPEESKDFIQKAGLSDYDFVKGMANITGYYFWVDADENGEWTLHFKNPDTVPPAELGQTKTYNFKWNEGDFSTILNFEPELAIQGQTNKLKVILKDPKSGAVRSVDVSETVQSGPEVISDSGGGRFTLDSSQTAKVKDQKLETEFTTPGAIKLLIGDFSFQVKTNRTFATEDEVAVWAREWFENARNNFILARVLLPGVESLRARQVHKLSGLGIALSGDYFFNMVRHKMDGNGYTCDCQVRKLIKSTPPQASVLNAGI